MGMYLNGQIMGQKPNSRSSNPKSDAFNGVKPNMDKAFSAYST